VRVDEAVRTRVPLTTAYDPLLAKVMVHAGDRPAAVARLRRALDEMLVGGLQTDLGFDRWLVDQPGFVSGDYDTGFITAEWGEGPNLTAEETALVALAAEQARASTGAGARPLRTPAPRTGSSLRPGDSAWARLGRQDGLRR